jgi:HD-GYP domain-containing protein (c-di-GMP phosphodiesterase class II)
LKDIDKLVAEVISALQSAMALYNANLFLLREDKLVCSASQGGYRDMQVPPADFQIELGEGIIGMAAQTGQPILVNDTSADLRYRFWEGLPDTRSELAVPVKSGDHLLGILDVQSNTLNAFDNSDLEAIGVLADQLAVALDNTHLFEQTSRRAGELEVLSRVSAALRVTVTRADMLAVTLDQVTEMFHAQAAAITLREGVNGGIQVSLGSGSWANLTGETLPNEWASWEYVIATGQAYVNNYGLYPSTGAFSHQEDPIQAMACVPLIAQEKTIGALAVGRQSPITDEEVRVLSGIGDMIASAIQRSSLFEQTQRNAEQMAAVGAIGRSLAESLDTQEIYTKLAQSIQELFPDVATVLISNYDPVKELITCMIGLQDGERLDVSKLPAIPLAPSGEGTQSLVIRKRQPLIVDDLPNKLKVKYKIGKNPNNTLSALYVPLLAKGDVLGVIQVQSYTPSRFRQTDAELLMLIANTGAIAIENAQLFGEIKQRVQRLGALRAMDMAISSSFDLRVTLNVLLDQITSQLEVDAACVLMYNAHTRSLEYAAGRGFGEVPSGNNSLRLDQSLAGRAALERRLIHIPNLSASKGTRPLLQTVGNEPFLAYYAVPLIVKGQVKGVLEIYNHSPLAPDPEWMEFLETLAGDAAIAIDNTALFNELQRSNLELTLAYDRTLEGWSHALELRDEETEGHAHRVVEKTVQLALAMGMHESELVHVRRGALLHDIGKMGVPDVILHKRGPLTEEEWEVMRRHPTDAFELLSRIPYLKTALDIPYRHHERWDGSGYPDGLQGEEIPLAARIFAVVDVWDALLSERPYRHAWPEAEVIAYLRDNAGRQFDPTVVEMFLRLLDQK